MTCSQKTTFITDTPYIVIVYLRLGGVSGIEFKTYKSTTIFTKIITSPPYYTIQSFFCIFLTNPIFFEQPDIKIGDHILGTEGVPYHNASYCNFFLL